MTAMRVFAALILVGSAAVVWYPSGPVGADVTDEPSDLLPEAPAPEQPPPNAESLSDPTIPRSAIAQPPLSASFTMHHRGASESFRLTGEVQNTSAVPIGFVTVHAIFLDDAGKEVFSATQRSDDAWLDPGQTAPLSLWISAASDFEEIRFETIAQPPQRRLADHSALVIEPHEPRPTRFGGHAFSGRLRNEGSTPATFVRVRVTGFDDEDKIVGSAATYAVGKQELRAGSFARYSLDVTSWLSPPKRFEYDIIRR